MDFSQILDSKYASIHKYANKCEAIYMSAVAAFFTSISRMLEIKIQIFNLGVNS